MSNTILKMEKISKTFPGVKALQQVDFSLKKGEVHALMGENGAGKSTLMKCLGGIYSIDSGTITLNAQPVQIDSVLDSISHGISIIHQELALNEQVTVADNIFMGREPITKAGFIDRKAAYNRSQELIHHVGGDFSAYSIVGQLSTAQKQLIEIAKALSMDAQIIVMDEPTSVLTSREVESLFHLIAQLKSEGIGVVYISHRMEEVFEISDRITVLRDGQYIQTLQTAETTKTELINLMVGRELDEFYVRSPHKIGETLLKVENMKSTDGKIKDASFCLKQGEVLGFSGLVGSGRSELMKMIFGVDKKASGKVWLRGNYVDIRSSGDAIANGIGMVSEDRKLEGLFLQQDVEFNITIGVLEKFLSTFRLNKIKESNIALEYVEALSIKVPSIAQKVVNLSGGNQQKVVLSKWLAIAPDILILDEPTRGIDVGAKAEIYAIIDTLIKKGVSIIMVSSDMPELINLCDRVYVMCNGEITADLSNDEINQEIILKFALGV